MRQQRQQQEADDGTFHCAQWKSSVVSFGRNGLYSFPFGGSFFFLGRWNSGDARDSRDAQTIVLNCIRHADVTELVTLIVARFHDLRFGPELELGKVPNFIH